MHRNERIVLRTRNGRTHSYVVLHPYSGELAESRKNAINLFAEASRQCSAEMNDPERLAVWQKDYERYCRRLRRRRTVTSAKKYATLRGYIIATISARIKAASNEAE